MKPLAHQSPGFGLALVLATALLGIGAWMALERPERLTDRGAAIDAKARADWPDMRIDVNAASAAELSALPGLGPALAQRIVDDREARGPFKSVDDLDRVKGIGKAIVERLRPYAVVERQNQ